MINIDIDGFEQFLQLQKYSDNTVYNYMNYCKEWVRESCEFNKEDMEKMIAKHNHRFYRAFLKSFFKYCNVKLEIPTIKGREIEKNPVYYTEEEINKLFESMPLKLELMCRLMYEAGLRISEVLDLKKEDIDMKNRLVKGIGKEKKEFSQPFFEDTYKLLGGYLDSFKVGDEYVFRWEGIGWQRHKALYLIRKAIMNILPYKRKKEAFVHAFRHSTGTALNLKGMTSREIQVYLRHVKLDTVRNYIAIDRQRINEKAKNILGGEIDEKQL